jgi:hypothetical protein
MPIIADGRTAPDFSLTAVVSKRQVTLQDGADQLLLIFHTYHTARLVGDTVKRVKRTNPDPDRLLVAAVTDLSSIPRLLHGVARKILSDAYQEAAQEVPPGEQVADHIVILPDWKGSVSKAYQVPKGNDKVAMVLIDQARLIQGTYVGQEPVEAALALLNGAGGR